MNAPKQADFYFTGCSADRTVPMQHNLPVSVERDGEGAEWEGRMRDGSLI